MSPASFCPLIYRLAFSGTYFGWLASTKLIELFTYVFRYKFTWLWGLNIECQGLEDAYWTYRFWVLVRMFEDSMLRAWVFKDIMLGTWLRVCKIWFLALVMVREENLLGCVLGRLEMTFLGLDFAARRHFLGFWPWCLKTLLLDLMWRYSKMSRSYTAININHFQRKKIIEKDYT